MAIRAVGIVALARGAFGVFWAGARLLVSMVALSLGEPTAVGGIDGCPGLVKLTPEALVLTATQVRKAGATHTIYDDWQAVGL